MTNRKTFIHIVCFGLLFGYAEQGAYGIGSIDSTEYSSAVDTDSKKYWDKPLAQVFDRLKGLLERYIRENQYEKAEVLCKRIIAACHEEGYQPFEAYMHEMLGSIEEQLKKTDAAAESYIKALDLTEQALGPKNKIVGDVLLHLGKLYMDNGEFQKAEPVFSRAADIFDQARHSDFRNCDRAFCFCLVGDFYGQAKNDEKAAEWYQKALLSYFKERNQRKYLTDVRYIKQKLASIYVRQGRLEEAENVLQNEIYRVREITKDPHNLAEATEDFARIFVKEKKLEVAASQYEEAIALEEKSGHLSVWWTSSAASDLANLYEQLNRPDRAEFWHKRSIAIGKNDNSPNRYFLIRSLTSYQKMLTNLNRTSEAEAVGCQIKSISRPL